MLHCVAVAAIIALVAIAFERIVTAVLKLRGKK